MLPPQIPILQLSSLLSLVPLFGYDISQTGKFNFIDENQAQQAKLRVLDAFGVVFPYTFTQGGARLLAVLSQLSSSELQLRCVRP